MTSLELKIFRDSLGISESGYDNPNTKINEQYYNDRGQYWGKYQFGKARRKDIEKILGLPHLTRDQFTPEMQEHFFLVHVNDLEKQIYRRGFDQYFGNPIVGRANKIRATVNKYGLLAGMHLGGPGGVIKYFTTSYDATDNSRADGGTYISDYIAKFSAISEKKISLRKLA